MSSEGDGRGDDEALGQREFAEEEEYSYYSDIIRLFKVFDKLNLLVNSSGLCYLEVQKCGMCTIHSTPAIKNEYIWYVGQEEGSS
jgi:hypothetical protein